MATAKLDKLEEKVDLIMENHLPHINAAIIQTGNDVAWLKQFFWIVASSSIGALLIGILNLLMKQ